MSFAVHLDRGHPSKRIGRDRMQHLKIAGRLTDRGKTPPFTIPLNVALTLEQKGTQFVYADDVDVLCTGGAFEGRFSVTSEVESEFTASGSPETSTGTAGGVIHVRIMPYAPGFEPFEFEAAVVALFAHDQTFLGVAESLVDDLEYDLDLSRLVHYEFGALLSDDELTGTNFATVKRLTCEVMQYAGSSAQPLVRAAPGKDGAPSDPDVEEAVDALNTAILNGPAKGQSPEGWLAEVQDLAENANDAGKPTPDPTNAPAYTRYVGVPAFRTNNHYVADVVVRQDHLEDRSFFVRFRSDGNDLKNQVVLRGSPLPPLWPASDWGLISRVDTTTGIGTMSKTLDDRSYTAPFILMDPDLDVVNKKLRVRGGIGVGLGTDVMLARIASIDVTLSLGTVDHDEHPFSDVEFDDFSRREWSTLRSTCCRGPTSTSCPYGCGRCWPASGSAESRWRCCSSLPRRRSWRPP
jgi:hypothetical protein